MKQASKLVRWLLPDAAVCFGWFVALTVALGPLRSPDLFFHLAGGRYLLEHHHFPSRDPFSDTATAQFPHEWSFGVLAELALRTFGVRGPELIVASLLAATFCLLWRLLAPREERGLLVLLLFGAAQVAQSPTWKQERPYQFAHVLFCVGWLLARRFALQRDRRAAWAFVPLSLLWVNLHGSWPLAPLLLGLTSVGLLATDGRRDRGLLLQGLGATFASFAIVALSPGGIATYTYPLLHASLPSTQWIAEWKPLDPTMDYGRAILALGALGLFLVGRGDRRDLSLLLPAAALGVLVLGARRHCTFAGIALAACCAELARTQQWTPWQQLPPPWLGAFARLQRGIVLWNRVAGGGALLALTFIGIAVHALRHPIAAEDALEDIPIELIDRLRGQPPGKVLNVFQWGGPISYFAGPEFKVYIDSRNDPFPLAIHEQYQRMVKGERGWREALESYDPQYLFWSRDSSGGALLELIGREGGWQQLGSKDKIELWVRVRRNRFRGSL